MSFIRELAISLPILIIIAVVGTHLVVVPTGSMSPAINEGDMVLVEKTDVLGLIEELNPQEVKEGDIIIYEKSNTSEEASVIHRVIAVNKSEGKKTFTLKGDNNTISDKNTVSTESVKGRVITWGADPVKIPVIGWLMLWFKGTPHE